MSQAPTVIDANCMKYFQEERVSSLSDRYTRMMNFVQLKGCIAIDDEGRAQQEYNDCCRPSAVGLNLCDWIADQIVNKFIVMFSMDRSTEETLRKLGVPKADRKWPSIAKGSKADVIITDDIDLFDPSAKKCDGKKKNKIRAAGGCVSKYLRKEHGIIVMTSTSFVEHAELSVPE